MPALISTEVTFRVFSKQIEYPLGEYQLSRFSRRFVASRNRSAVKSASPEDLTAAVNPSRFVRMMLGNRQKSPLMLGIRKWSA
jgi:hypothetical protein